MRDDVRILRYIGLLLVLHGALAAQPFLYHADQDKNAQLAVSTAKEIANGAVFDKELQNLDALSKLQIDRAMSWAQVQFRAGLDAFSTWKAVSDQLNKIDAKLPPLSDDEVKKRIAEVEKQVTELKATIKNLGEKAGASSDIVKEIDLHLKTVDDALAYAKDLPATNAKFSAAIASVKTGLDTAKTIYDAFTTAFEARKAVQDQLAKLATSPQADQLKLLLLEMKHLQWVAQNEARRDLEKGTVIALADAARFKLATFKLTDSTEPIEVTLETLATKARTDSGSAGVDARRELGSLLLALHEAAAARAQGDLPQRLFELRDTLEEARYSILQSGARVSGAEALIQNAVARLALYYQGGIKPAQIAQLLYNLSGMVSLPLIATK